MEDAHAPSRSLQPASQKGIADWDQESYPVEPPVWEVTPPPPDPTPESDLCRRRAESLRTQAAQTPDLTARHALEVAAVNWENLARHLARRAERRRPPASSRKLQAGRAALGVED